MTLVQLEYLVAVSENNSFSEAAKKCFVTQPTLSMQIQKLEDELDMLIFDRTKQPVVPTPMGQIIIEQARVALRESQKIKQIIRANQNQIDGELRIGIIPTIAPYLLPLFITHAIKQYPQINFLIEEILTDEVIRKVRNESLDIGIISTPVNEDGIKEEPLYYEPFVVYANQFHRLINSRLVQANDITLDDMWLLNEGHCFRSHALNLCGVNNQNLSKVALEFRTGSLESITKIIERQYGYTLLPYLATIYMEKAKLNQVRQFENPIPHREIGLVYKNTYLRKKTVEVLKQQIQANLPPEIPTKQTGMVVDWK